MDAVTEKNALSYDKHAAEWRAAMATNFGHKYLEKPAMAGLIPVSLEGKNVLCVGVGSGEELEEILRKNPQKVAAIDISSKLLEIAKSRFPEVEFSKMDMLHMEFPDESFDFIYSSLTFHYASDWDALLAEVNRVLKKNGTLLFSTHHPVYWGSKASTGNSHTNPRGITLTEHAAILPGEIEITYYNHANESSITEAVRHAGFEIQKFFVPKVQDVPTANFTPENADAYSKLRSKNEQSPLFFVVSALKTV